MNLLAVVSFQLSVSSRLGVKAQTTDN
jgi:hypothetical protein